MTIDLLHQMARTLSSGLAATRDLPADDESLYAFYEEASQAAGRLGGPRLSCPRWWVMVRRRQPLHPPRVGRPVGSSLQRFYSHWLGGSRIPGACYRPESGGAAIWVATSRGQGVERSHLDSALSDPFGVPPAAAVKGIVRTFAKVSRLDGSGDSVFSTLGGGQGIVHLAGQPQVVEQYGQLAGHGHRRAFLGALPPALADPQAEASEVAVGAEGPQYVVGGLDQVASRGCVAAPGDAQLGLPVTGAVQPWTQTQVSASSAAAGETARVLECEDEAPGGDRSDAGHLPQEGNFRIVLPAQSSDPAIQFVYVGRQLANGFQQRRHAREHVIAGSLANARGKHRRRALRQGYAQRLG